jgi:hypothetical protein
MTKKLCTLICFGSMLYFNFTGASQSPAIINPHPYPGGCVTVPSCPACGSGETVTGSCTGTNEIGFCNNSTSDYTVMTDGNQISVNTIPLILTQTDSTTVTCVGVSCNGGITTCKVNQLPTSLDSVLTQWRPSLNRLPATVTCKYYDPTCSSCYTAFTCSCGCAPAPPTTPPSACAVSCTAGSAGCFPFGNVLCSSGVTWDSTLSCYICN